MTYYNACHVECECQTRCDHEHRTVTGAVDCLSAAGDYVVAVEKREIRALNKKEEAEFQQAVRWKAIKDAKKKVRFRIKMRLKSG